MLYGYVGPPEIAEQVASEWIGQSIQGLDGLVAWCRDNAERDQDEIVATFVVDANAVLRLADRHSEHVVCAGGGPVLTAGELTVWSEAGQAEVVGASNQSTGFCPEVRSWTALEAALDTAGISHPGAWTAAFEFRRCESCRETNIVKDNWFECAICGAELPELWNYSHPGSRS